MAPLISIITPTYNRKDELVYLFASLQQQTLDHSLFEMIVSDDGSSDGTAELVAEWHQRVDFPLEFVTQRNQGPGAARNHGLATARGQLFLFIDSDCEARPDWLEAIYREYQADGFDACGGPDGAKDDFTPLQQAIDFAMTSFFTTGGMRGHSRRMLAKFYPRSHNMGITRTLYEKVGGFGSLRHGQDIELSHRIRTSGATVRFIPDAVVYHRRRTSLRRFFRQVFNWGVARVNLGKISSDLLEPIHFLPALALLVALMIVVGAPIWPTIFLPLLLIGIAGWLGLALYAGLSRKSAAVAGYALLTVPFQIGGYGAGFIIAFLKRFLFGKGAWTGFTKRYYD